MPRTPRRELLNPGEVGMVHCIQRCVRRAYLCGEDPLTGRNFEHRCLWIRQRLEFLAGQFGIDVAGFAVLGNHLHTVLRSRPDIVALWSDEEIARRWWNLFPARKDAQGGPAEPEPRDLQRWLADATALAERRRRLSDISWFMRCLAEPIARRANFEDHCSGHFWEGRFKCQILLDDSAILACSMYVDLNLIRAGLAATPEESTFTGAHERIAASQALAVQAAQDRAAVEPPAEAPSAIDPTHLPDSWLSPISEQPAAIGSEEPPAVRVSGSQASTRRASDRGFLPMSLDQYLALLDWTGRQIRADKRGSIPAELAPILDRLQIRAEAWVDTVIRFGRSFRQAAGRRANLVAEAQRRGRRWLHGTTASCAAFA